GPNIENFEKKFYKQCKLGWGPNIEGDVMSAYFNVQVGLGPQHREIGFPISTDNASWAPTFV
ncbi:hypothetical protein KCX17_04220, partial [Staphylococcus aureus]|nr:hypothetical protein [Staphylococcus aureus]